MSGVARQHVQVAVNAIDWQASLTRFNRHRDRPTIACRVIIVSLDGVIATPGTPSHTHTDAKRRSTPLAADLTAANTVVCIDWLHFCKIASVLKLSATVRQSWQTFFSWKIWVCWVYLFQFVKFNIEYLVRNDQLFNTGRPTGHTNRSRYILKKNNNIFISTSYRKKNNFLHEFLLFLYKINSF